MVGYPSLSPPSPLLDGSGDAVGSMAIYTDLSDLRRAEATEVRYQTLVETMRDGLIAVDSAAVITFANPALGKMLGYRPDELLGRPAAELYDEENKKILEWELEKRRQGISSTYEVKVTTRDGSQIPILTSAAPLLDDSGAMVGSIAIQTDLSDLRRAEAEVRKAAGEWRQCFDALEDLVVVIDNNYRVQRCNRAMSKYLGLDFSQIVGQPCYRLLHGTSCPLPECLHKRMLQTGKAVTDDQRDPKTGVLFSVTVSPITDDQGQPLGNVHLYKDVTEQRRREQERVQLALELTKGLEATTLALTNMVDSRDPYTSGHSQRVAELALQVGAEMGMSRGRAHRPEVLRPAPRHRQGGHSPGHPQ